MKLLFFLFTAFRFLFCAECNQNIGNLSFYIQQFPFLHAPNNSHDIAKRMNFPFLKDFFSQSCDTKKLSNMYLIYEKKQNTYAKTAQDSLYYKHILDDDRQLNWFLLFFFDNIKKHFTLLQAKKRKIRC